MLLSALAPNVHPPEASVVRMAVPAAREDTRFSCRLLALQMIADIRTKTQTYPVSGLVGCGVCVWGPLGGGSAENPNKLFGA
jgi:hypothetical protein